MMNRRFFVHTLFTWSIITCITLSAAKQDSLVSQYLQTENIAIQTIQDKNIKTARNNYYNGLLYVDVLLSALEEKKPTLAVHSLDQQVLKKIDFIRTQSSIANTSITPLGLHRALKMLQEPVTEQNFSTTQNNRLDIISQYKQKAPNFNMEITRNQTQECIKKIVDVCTHGLGLYDIFKIPSAGDCFSYYNIFSTGKSILRKPDLLSIASMGLQVFPYLLSGYTRYKRFNTPYSKEEVTGTLYTSECTKFLQNIEAAIDSVRRFNNNSQLYKNLDLKDRLKQKLELISVFDLYATLADLANNGNAAIGVLEKKNDAKDIKTGIQTACNETKNQTLILAPNEQGSSFGKNFLVMKKNKNQTQETMYDVAANIVCAHAFNVLLGNNMKKDLTTMPFIDVYHLIVATKTYSTNKDFTFLEEIYIPLKTLSS